MDDMWKMFICGAVFGAAIINLLWMVLTHVS